MCVIVARNLFSLTRYFGCICDVVTIVSSYQPLLELDELPNGAFGTISSISLNFIYPGCDAGISFNWSVTAVQAGALWKSSGVNSYDALPEFRAKSKKCCSLLQKYTARAPAKGSPYLRKVKLMLLGNEYFCTECFSILSYRKSPGPFTHHAPILFRPSASKKCRLEVFTWVGECQFPIPPSGFHFVQDFVHLAL